MTVRVRYLFYDISESEVIQMMPTVWWQVLYVVVVGIPLLIAPSRGFVVFGIALLVAAVVTHFCYWYAFVSVWCFFSAVLSLYLCYSFRRLPTPYLRAIPPPDSNRGQGVALAESRIL